ncbi:MAG TPA: hypothetical protein VL326_26480 [Kofleriaceae bacterium]|jgi:hypothetical protein|nr:hypothetical protein [Kofleriaceae bacterium]
MSLKLISLAALPLLATLAACDSQVDSDHQGTPLAKLTGSVGNTRTLPVTSGAEVVAVWQKSSGSPDLTGVGSVEVEGSFPAQFTLSIYEPPDASLLNDWEGVHVGVALLVAGVPGTDYSNEHAAEAGLLGMEENHLLVYLPQAVPAGSAAAALLHGTPSAGFHLYNVGRISDAEKQQREDCINGLSDPTVQQIYSQCGGEPYFDDFVPTATDLATQLFIELVDDLSQIDIPNWT